MLVPSYDVKNVAQLHVGLGRFFDHFWNNSTLQCQRTFIININTNYKWGSICDFFVIHTVYMLFAQWIPHHTYCFDIAVVHFLAVKLKFALIEQESIIKPNS